MLCRWNRYLYTNSLLCTLHAVLGNFLFLHVLSWRHNLVWLYTQWIICLPAGALPRVVPTINQQVQQEVLEGSSKTGHRRTRWTSALCDSSQTERWLCGPQFTYGRDLQTFLQRGKVITVFPFLLLFWHLTEWIPLPDEGPGLQKVKGDMHGFWGPCLTKGSSQREPGEER